MTAAADTRSYADRARARRRNATWCVDCGQRPAYARGRCEACWRAAYRASSGWTRHVPSAWHLPPPWTAGAACAQADDPDLFFPEPGTTGQAAAAKKICAACPVRGKCLDYALDLGEIDEGIWGGMTPAERQAEHQRRKTAAAAAGRPPAA